MLHIIDTFGNFKKFYDAEQNYYILESDSVSDYALPHYLFSGKPKPEVKRSISSQVKNLNVRLTVSSWGMPFCVAFDHTPAQPSGPRLPMLSGDFLWGKGAQGPEVRSINRERDASRVQRAPGNQSKGRRVQGAWGKSHHENTICKMDRYAMPEVKIERWIMGNLNAIEHRRPLLEARKGGRAAGRDCGKLIRTPKVIKAERKWAV